MKTIEGKIVDIIQKKIYPARLSFDSHIRKIESLSASPDIYIMPGLIDAHVHIESSMLPPSEFARIALRHGTLAVVSDPHEIANVLGIEGVNFMLEDAARVPFRFVFGAPSCVPATSFETAGATITADDIGKLFADGKVGYLSEMMNFPGVVNDDQEVMSKIAVAHKYRKPVDGHAPGLIGKSLEKYIQAGISTDHECSTLEEAEEKIRLGIKIQIRNGSAAKNFDALFPLIEKYPDRVMLCSDDLHPDDLFHGHINVLLEKGLSKGLNLFSLMQAAIINPVSHYQIDLGLLQQDDSADFIVVDNLKDFVVRKSFFRGACVYDRAGEEQHLTEPIPRSYPNRFAASRISLSDIEIIAISDKMKIIDTSDGSLFTKQGFCDVVQGTEVTADTTKDILKMVVLNRYQPAKPAVAFVRGFGLKKGALASTVSHDSHQIIAIGCDDVSILTAINHIIDIKGGLTACYENKLIDLKLDIAGLMSSAPGDEVARMYEMLNKASADMGCVLTSPFMTLSFMALLVIPELKLSDKGLFDVNRFQWTDLFICP